MFAIKTHFKNSLEIRKTIVEIDAPKTFLIPISLILLSTVKAVKPKRPRHAMNIARMENDVNICPVFCSD